MSRTSRQRPTRRPACFDGRPPNLSVKRQEEKRYIDEQIAEDTCEAHGAFCCTECFDMEPIERIDPEFE